MGVPDICQIIMHALSLLCLHQTQFSLLLYRLWDVMRTVKLLPSYQRPYESLLVPVFSGHLGMYLIGYFS